MYKSKWWEKIYFPIYRFFRWKKWHSIPVGLKNLWNWKGIIWKDRDWDDGYIWDLLNHKFKNMEKRYHPDNELDWDFVGRDKVYKEIKTARILTDRICKDDYEEDWGRALKDAEKGIKPPIERDIEYLMYHMSKYARKWWD